MKLKIPHTFVIITVVLLLCGILTWIIPAGEFTRTEVVVDGSQREVIIADSYHHVEQAPQTWQIFGSIVDGFKRQAGIIAFILIIGGAFGLLAGTRAIEFGINSFLESSKKWENSSAMRRIGVGNIVITCCMLIFSIFGAVFGMSEETIAFVIIIVPLAISMGYDSITGLLMVYVAAHIGFSGAMFNPFTIGIAQGLSGVPIFSGFEYRFVVWIILTTLIIAFTLIYASRIKRSPELSPTYKIDDYWRQKLSCTTEISSNCGNTNQKSNSILNNNPCNNPKDAHSQQDNKDISNNNTTSLNGKAGIGAYFICTLISILLIVSAIIHPKITLTIGSSSASFICFPIVAVIFIISGILTLRKGALPFILNILCFTILVLIIGVLGYGWYISEIATLFIAMGICSTISVGWGSNKIAVEFINGAKDILSAALVVGLAGGIIEILTNGKILDTILYSLASGMEGGGKIGSISAMYGIQTVLNLFIPSGSAKAALTMPIMAPFSDIIGISRQATIVAFQLGDGFTNMITPTSGVLLGALGAARIPYSLWIKWFWKILLVFILIGLLLLIPTVLLNLPGF